MSHENDVNALLQQYAAETGVRSVQKVEKDFAEIAQRVPSDHVSNGLSEAIRSEHTPPFEEMVGQSYEQGDPQTRAGMLNQLLEAGGAAAARPLVENGLLSDVPADDTGRGPVVDQDLAGRLQPELVQQIALEATREDPGVIDRMSILYAEDAALLKTLGGATLGVALNKIAENR
jgi:hypothetical protein